MTEQTKPKTIQGKAEASVSTPAAESRRGPQDRCIHCDPSFEPEIDSLSDRELDALVAGNLFGIKKIFRAGVSDSYQPEGEYCYIPSGKPPRTHMIDSRAVPYFSSDIASAMQVEDRIAELGLQTQYVESLQGQLFEWVEYTLDTWKLIHATPRQRCLAALQACKTVASTAPPSPTDATVPSQPNPVESTLESLSVPDALKGSQSK